MAKKNRAARKRSSLLLLKKGKKVPPLILGFDLGATKLASGVVSDDGKVLAKRKDLINFTSGATAFIEFLAEIAEYWIKKYPSKIKALGIASCGPLDVHRGVLLQPTNFPKWGNLPIAAPLRRRLKIPVVMHNDAAAAAAAEGWLGGAKNLENWMVLTFGTGLGTGIVMNRKVFMGGSGLGPEAGHVIITDKPYLCGCGNYGCAEAALSGTGLRKRIEENTARWGRVHISAPKNPEELVERARGKHDLIARDIFGDFSRLLARAIHGYSVMFKPEKIFIAGGLMNAHDLFLNQAQLEVAEMLKGRPGFTPELSISKLGRDSGILSGAWVAMHRVLKRA